MSKRPFPSQDEAEEFFILFQDDDKRKQRNPLRDSVKVPLMLWSVAPHSLEVTEGSSDSQIAKMWNYTNVESHLVPFDMPMSFETNDLVEVLQRILGILPLVEYVGYDERFANVPKTEFNFMAQEIIALIQQLPEESIEQSVMSTNDVRTILERLISSSTYDAQIERQTIMYLNIPRLRVGSSCRSEDVVNLANQVFGALASILTHPPSSISTWTTIAVFLCLLYTMKKGGFVVRAGTPANHLPPSRLTIVHHYMLYMSFMLCSYQSLKTIWLPNQETPKALLLAYNRYAKAYNMGLDSNGNPTPELQAWMEKEAEKLPVADMYPFILTLDMTLSKRVDFMLQASVRGISANAAKSIGGTSEAAFREAMRSVTCFYRYLLFLLGKVGRPQLVEKYLIDEAFIRGNSNMNPSQLLAQLLGS